MGTKEKVQWQSTKYPGVRFREHPTRKHGIRLDRYFSIRYQRDGLRKEEGLGWATEGWTAEKAFTELSQLKKAHLIGEGPSRLTEKRQLQQTKREQEEQERIRLEKENVTFGQYFIQTYFPISKSSKKASSYIKEHEHFKHWIDPVLGPLAFKSISPLNIERVKKNLLNAERSPRTIQYVFATIRQVWNMARRDGLVSSETPSKQVKIPKLNNQRLRFLSPDEANSLLENLKVRSRTVHDMALVSLYCGLRAGEIFSLTWGTVDTDKGLISIIDAKGDKNRIAYMTDRVKHIFREMERGKHGDLVFSDNKGRKFREMPGTFATAVDAIGLNRNVSDPRMRVVFHSLRHTYASWLVQGGTDLYTVKVLMGHSTMAMTERYSHLSNNTLQNAVKNLERTAGAREEERDDSARAGDAS